MKRGSPPIAALAALLSVSGCAATVDEAPAAPGQPAALPVGRPCSVARTPERSAPGPRVLVEVAEMRLDPQRRAGEAPHVAVAWSAYQLADDGRRSTMVLTDGTTGCAAAECRALSVTPHVDPSSGGVRIELRIDQGNTQLAHTTAAVGDQQAVLLALDKERRSVLAVTPYVANNEAELQSLVSCKRAERVPPRSVQ